MNNIPEILLWLIPGLPLAAFLVIFILLRLAKNRSSLNGYLAIAATSASLLLSIWVLAGILNGEHTRLIAGFEWFAPVETLNISIGLIIDPLAAIMLIVVTTVSLMVQIYSLGYMHGSKSLNRYFAFISLFTMAMLGLVMADNLLVMFMCWEIVGVCSYQLIGFWFHRPAAAQAGRKAFFITRLGDFGFLAAILIIFNATGTLDVNQIHSLAAAGTISGSVITLAAIGIFMGAMGKSAQFPLHTWLPDAMEGPTPVSALIHAATMVAAGVFLVARMYPLFEHSTTALNTVAIVGAITAIFAGSIALVMHDIKKVLAYSTISQLGYMMLGLGLGGVSVAIFHLFVHAFFKALLFMGAGSVNHSTGTFDMRKMGGLRKVMPWTCLTFIIGSLSLSGIWPLAGFFSKEEILSSALSSQPILFAILLITAFMTAFYMFRVVFMTFGGKYRGRMKPHESEKVMLLPMAVLSILAIFAGWFNATGGFSSLLGHELSRNWLSGIFGVFTHPLAWVSLLVAGSGIFLAYAIYQKHWLSEKMIAFRLHPIYAVLVNKFWVDELYEYYIGDRLLSSGLFNLLHKFDVKVIDGLVNGIARKSSTLFGIFHQFDLNVIDGLVNNFGRLNLYSGNVIRQIQNGRLQLYALIFLCGLSILAVLVILVG